MGFSAQTRVQHPELFIQVHVDRGKCHRTTPMQVLAPGLPRTGIGSIRAVLQRLGFATHNGLDMYGNLMDPGIWNEAYNIKFRPNALVKTPELGRTFFDQALGHVNAVADIHCASFAQELILAYPKAEVVLVE